MALKPCHLVAEKLLPVSADVMWEVLGNTEHLNRTIGLPSVTYGMPVIDRDRFYRMAAAKGLGILLMRWQEYPFDWVSNERYSVLRVFESGPLDQLVGGIELQDTSTGTVVRIFADVTPRYTFARPLAYIIGKKGVTDTMRYCEKCVKLAQSGSSVLYPRQRTRTPVSRSELEVRLTRLRDTPVQKHLIEALNRHLLAGTDEEVLHMRPFVLAKKWQANHLEVLRLFLYATKIGVLNLRWEMMCPSCRIPKAEYPSLSELTKTVHCDLCGVDFEADLDRYVELRFSVHPAIRKAVDALYCIGGPMNTPHILCQQYLGPASKRTVTFTLPEDAVRIRALRSNHTASLTRSQAAESEFEITYTPHGWYPENLAYRPGQHVVHLANPTNQPVVVVLERVHWDQEAVTAAQVTTMQEFRNLFDSEVLAPEQEISIQNLTLLFTDLKGSTELYEEVGDASAYGRVRRHFDFLTERITRNHGALVKTIGDAVMAVFINPEAAVRAALEMQGEIKEFCADRTISPPLTLKIGIHHGPAIAINSNNLFDYFGRTVNIAARAGQQSVGEDVILTEDMVALPAVQDVLQNPPAPFEATLFTTTLKGIEETFTLHRLVVKSE